MNKEEWRDMPEYEKYITVSNLGRVYFKPRKYINALTGAEMPAGDIYPALANDKDGYKLCNFSLNGESTTFKVHRMVLMAFSPVENYKELSVNHKDGVKGNNNIENLEWATHKENINHAIENGLITFPKRTVLEDINCDICGNIFTPNSKRNKFCSSMCANFKRRKVERPSKDELYSLLLNNSFSKVGEMLGVTDNSIRKWCKSYGISSKSAHYRDKGKSSSEILLENNSLPRNPQAKLTDDEVREIRKRYVYGSRGKNGATNLAKEYEVDRTAILRIARGESYRDVK